MRLLLYNIRYGAGTGRRFHFPVPYSGYLKPVNGNFDRIVQYVKSVQPDLVGLIEADFGSFRVDNRNQAKHIAREIDHETVFQSKYDADSLAQKLPLLNKQGNAVLTNQDILDTKFHYFQNGFKRLIIEVELMDLRFFLVHLSLKFRHRQYQLHDLHSLVADSDKPVVIAGDFNVLWGDRELQLFLAASGLVNANAQGQASWPSRSPLLQLDYIFHSPEIRTRQFQIPPVKLSDHAPLVWDFEVQSSQSIAFPGTGLAQAQMVA